jgi:hypothetical protein
MMMNQNKNVIVLSLVLAFTVLIMLSPVMARADPNGVKKGNNGRCIKLQKIFPPEIQDYQGCHDTFTGPGHNNPPPLP